MNLSIQRTQYIPYPYLIPSLKLQIKLDLNQTVIRSHFQVHTSEPGTTLVLDGEDLTLLGIWIDGKKISKNQYQLDSKHLSIDLDQTSHLIEIENYCEPANNSTLMGLYQSGQQLFTQCEPEGFRRITWFADRPDVLSRYTVELVGDRVQFPYLLSNGNLISHKDLKNGMHQAIWEDPFAKPSYLFAVVAGDFDCREETITTASKREVLLQVYSDKGDKPKTAWAMQSLINALEWDEQRFGLELDLERYMIVSAADFNMGAMENKGLNVFNAAYVLAEPQTTTDQSYRDIEAVIGHEYFHNWTGNRVTCRDWFQLSLKEGLTVFRDQEFSADMIAKGLTGTAADSAKAVKRIDDISVLRLAQFPEDMGPMAHPIRPNSYQEISNFYTATIYEKGAEVIRMFHTLLGEIGFQTALKNYFSKFDGQAITCDDFMLVMDEQYQQQYPGRNLSCFARWYEQAGTPQVKVQLKYDQHHQIAILTLKQTNPPVGIELLEQPPAIKRPLLIPFKLGFLDEHGQSQTVSFNGEPCQEVMLPFEQLEQEFIFTDVAHVPVLSLLRDFSAPIKVDFDQPITSLVTLAKYDNNAFSRWQAIQELACKTIFETANGSNTQLETALLDVWQHLLTSLDLSAAYLSRALTLPTVRELLAQQHLLDPVMVRQAHRHIETLLAEDLVQRWYAVYKEHHRNEKEYTPNAAAAGSRALKNLALKQLAICAHSDWIELAQTQYQQAANMTDQWGALHVLVHYADQQTRQSVLADFYTQWQDNALVIDRWFSVQASAPYFDVEQALQLQAHPDFNLRNPNRARALIFQFCTNNLANVHTEAGYTFWHDQVLALDELNPEISARLCRIFDNWSHYVEPLRSQLQQRLQSISQHPKLSANVNEIVHKALTIE